LVAGDKVKVDGLGIFYTTLTCPGVEQEKDCTVKDLSLRAYTIGDFSSPIRFLRL